MNNIIDISANQPHEVSEIMCWCCGKRWISVCPVGTLLKDLECPQCRNIGGAFKTGQELDAKST